MGYVLDMDRPLDETPERHEPASPESQEARSDSSDGIEAPTPIRTSLPQSTVVSPDDLATRKLRLEIKALEFRHSFVGHAIDVLQIILPIAALLTFTWTVIIGLKQQSRQVAEDQRTHFANAYMQLGSALPAQRISGIAQLNDLIGSAGEQRDQEIFIALINQLSLETDTTVGTALMTVFSKIGPETRAATKTAILETIANRQFSIAGGSGLDPTQIAMATQSQDKPTWEIPPISSSQWPNRGTTWREASEEEQQVLKRLTALSQLFMHVFSEGGRATNLKGLYCKGCSFMNIDRDDHGLSFRKLVLHDADFSFAILPACHFDQADLRGAKFLDTYLVGTSFRGANLQKAVFTSIESFSWNAQKLATEGADWDSAQTRSDDVKDGQYVFSDSGGPIFDYADLTDANLGYAPWYSIARFGSDDKGRWVLATAPTFERAVLTRTYFSPIATVIAYVKRKPTSYLQSTAPFKVLFRDLQRRDQDYDYSVLPVIADQITAAGTLSSLYSQVPGSSPLKSYV